MTDFRVRGLKNLNRGLEVQGAYGNAQSLKGDAETLGSLGKSGSASKVPKFCWKDSYGRGVGTIPKNVPLDKTN